jgi:hypothetical protein
MISRYGRRETSTGKEGDGIATLETGICLALKIAEHS